MIKNLNYTILSVLHDLNIAAKFCDFIYVIDKENIELSMQRLALVEATRITLKNALNLIGVEAPEKM